MPSILYSNMVFKVYREQLKFVYVKYKHKDHKSLVIYGVCFVQASHELDTIIQLGSYTILNMYPSPQGPQRSFLLSVFFFFFRYHRFLYPMQLLSNIWYPNFIEYLKFKDGSIKFPIIETKPQPRTIRFQHCPILIYTFSNQHLTTSSR